MSIFSANLYFWVNCSCKDIIPWEVTSFWRKNNITKVKEQIHFVMFFDLCLFKTLSSLIYKKKMKTNFKFKSLYVFMNILLIFVPLPIKRLEHYND